MPDKTDMVRALIIGGPFDGDAIDIVESAIYIHMPWQPVASLNAHVAAGYTPVVREPENHRYVHRRIAAGDGPTLHFLIHDQPGSPPVADWAWIRTLVKGYRRKA